MKTNFCLLVIFSVLVAGAAQARDVRDALNEGRQSLTGARLTATDNFQRKGFLPPAQVAAIDEMISDADKIWTACLIEYVDRAAPTQVAPTEVVERAMNQCTGDRDEMAAWIRLGGKVHHEEIETDLSSLLAKLDTKQAAAALNRLLKTRASAR